MSKGALPTNPMSRLQLLFFRFVVFLFLHSVVCSALQLCFHLRSRALLSIARNATPPQRPRDEAVDAPARQCAPAMPAHRSSSLLYLELSSSSADASALIQDLWT